LNWDAEDERKLPVLKWPCCVGGLLEIIKTGLRGGKQLFIFDIFTKGVSMTEFGHWSIDYNVR